MTAEKQAEDPETKASKKVLILAEKLGEFIKYWGFKSIHGRIWCLIYLSEKPVETDYLLKSLDISKALLCISTKELEAYNVIYKVPGSNKKSICYKANTDLVSVIRKVLEEREKKHLDRIQECLKSPHLKSSKHVNEQRLSDLNEMTALASTSLDKIIELKELDMSIWKMLVD